MKTFYSSFRVVILYSVCVISAKPIDYDKSVSDDTLHCVESNEGPQYERNTPNSFSDFYKSHARYEGMERYPNRMFTYDKKRSLSEEEEEEEDAFVQKRQVGVVYKDDKPIGILQPFQRSYRFLPLNDENSYGPDANQAQDISFNRLNLGGVTKRETRLGRAQNLEASYPSILANFKIDNKLDKKRNYDAFSDDNVRDLKETIRQLRSPHTYNTEQIEEELKNILDDMGLIDDDEIHTGGKREITEDQRDDEDESLMGGESKFAQEDRGKRDETYSKLGVENERNLLLENEKEGEFKNELTDGKRETSDDENESNRKKRQQQSMIPSKTFKKSLELVENLKDSDDLPANENKSPLVTKSEIAAKDTVSNSEYEKRVERQIQSKINSLKEEVKREIEFLKKKQQNEEDTQRKKRQVTENLVDEETDQLNPAINIEGELKPLIRKRRTVDANHLNISSDTNIKMNNPKRRKREANILDSRNKRSEHSVDSHTNQKNYKAGQDNGDEGGELLGDDVEQSFVSKRQIFNGEQYADLDNENTNLNEILYSRGKRSRVAGNSDFYEDFHYDHYDDDDDVRLRRQSNDNDFPEKVKSDRFDSFRSVRLRPRFRRRINENRVMPNRPQQLSDMSDLDLFGALPKGYDGELSRYKRVK